MSTARKNYPRAYSYVRWSSPEQTKGDSLRRQLERAKEYANTHGLDLSEDHWQDAGVAAYRGRNWHVGALGAFVEAVDAGRVSKGSYLLVEALDRLSRDHVLPALNRMQEITQRGITIVTLNDGQKWTKDSFKDLGPLYYSIAQLSTANIESRNKQARSLANWSQKRKLAVEQGIAPTRTCPLWLTVGDDGKYQPICERVEAVRKVYELALEGLGTRRIARKMNDLGFPKFTDPSRPKANDDRGWTGSYVHSLLITDATIGVWRGSKVIQPQDGDFVRRREQDAKDGFVEDGSVYPAIVDKDVWLKAQELIRVRKGENGRGRPKKPVGQAVVSMSNLFSGMCRCSCGAGLRYHRAAMDKRPKLVCGARLQGAKASCVSRRWDYGSVEAFLLYTLANHVDYGRLFPVAQEAARATLDRLEKELGTTEADLKLAEDGADNIVAAIEKGTDTLRMRDRIQNLEQTIEAHHASIAKFNVEITAERSRVDNVERNLTATQDALQEFIMQTWSKPYAMGEAFGFEAEEDGYVYDQGPPPLSNNDKVTLRAKLHQLLRQSLDGLTFTALADGSGRIALAFHHQEEQPVTLLVSKGDHWATLDDGTGEVMAMEKGPATKRNPRGLSKVLLTVYVDGRDTPDGEPEGGEEPATITMVV